MRNNKIVKLELTRIELCDLLLACLAAEEANDNGKKWKRLHAKLQRIIEESDKEYNEAHKEEN